MSKLLLYCTKNKWRLFFDKVKQVFTLGKVKSNNDLNGKIVAECDYEVEKINVLDCTFRTFNLVEKEILNKSCLTYHELFEYLKNRCNPRGYAIHIKNLTIYDKPKELSDYITKQCQYAKCSTCEYGKKEIHCATIDTPITKAPQNMMYCCTESGRDYILISIRPEWLVRILNHEKTIEVRKKVLKEMLKNE